LINLIVHFFFSSYADHRDLHSFPTRRSSDLYSYEGYVLLRPGEVAHAGFFLDEMLEAVGAEARKRIRLGIAKPEAALPLEFLARSEEHTSELQSLAYLVCRLLLEKKKDE